MENIEDWLTSSLVTESDKKVLINLKKKEQHELFEKSLEFGTGGMRGILGPGPNRMNYLTVARITAGFGKYLQTKYKKNLVIIGYDNRHFSQEFAEISAEILAGLGISVQLFPTLIPTPLVSFTIRKQQATGGIMITASHNPSEYNGFKVYDETGCQLLPQAIQEMKQALAIFQDKFEFNRARNLIFSPPTNIVDDYVSCLEDYFDLSPKNLLIGYSPLHGTGLIPTQKVFQHFNFKNFNILKEQASPDPRFSCTKSPNPENPDAFDKLIESGIKNGWDLLLANDPDADRLGAYYRDITGQYQRLSGNQIGAIFSKYLLKREKKPTEKFLVKTIVTSELGAEIARREGVKIIDVLTGFKYIGNTINQNNSADFLLGYEESFGFQYSPIVRDKDGIQAEILLAVIANDLKNEGKNLGDFLEEIYEEYGYYKEAQVSINLLEEDTVNKKEQLLKLIKEQIHHNFFYYEDFEKGLREYSTGEKQLINLPREKVIKVVYKDQSWICLRPSGTEPKIKIYFGVKNFNNNFENFDKLQKEILMMVDRQKSILGVKHEKKI